ncbi:thioesterase family protein [Povalibacter sp.]|uniref:thioesterase family protein n=1 Tax=Povalibacter sp. TaxID=1962978 RepID=UPI002F3FF258
MFPWLRLIKVSARLAGTARMALLETSRVRLRAWPNDLDINLHVNNGRYLALADLGRFDWFIRTGVFQLARRHDAVPVIGDAIAKFRREIKAWQAFEIHTRLVGWDERWAFLEHRFIREGRVIGVVAIRGVFRGPEGSLTPGELMAGLGVSMTSPPLPEWIREWHAGCESLSHTLRAEEAAGRTPRKTT